ncbi:polyketide synthase [Colletotrichum scovillei]|uniref:Polyketide synthase n=1 Tax=Colletotrichum scovillei TaxID=1209932 RepID=A0A9P7RF60_9PEZI|nr:polyketide synthase [Colletotrichum scovillei]KAG7074713.1 polyketide synthase [Colletotrichum scovillei]KAG7081795.1 polyketide synthase [Colletotrichum scovillei]
MAHCHEYEKVPAHKRAYVSYELEEWSVISGPPSTLSQLRLKNFCNMPMKDLPIFAAYHAEHLREPNYDDILGDSPLLDLPIQSNVIILSSSTGEMVKGSSLRAILPQVLRDILQRPSCPARVAKQIAHQLEPVKSSSDLYTFGPASQWSAFARRLKSSGVSLGAISSPALLQHKRTGDSISEHNHGDSHSDDEESDEEGNENLIAITGYSGRFPGAESAEELWDVLCNGRDTSSRMPRERVSDSHGNILPTGCFIEQAGHFDRKFFNMSGRAALQTDPSQRLLLLTTQEALDMSGYNKDIHTRHVGTFVGQATDDWREHNMAQDDPYYVTGGLRAFGPGRLNHFFGWDGPSVSVDTACSSSAMALDLAVQSLRGRKCNLAIAGGASIISGHGDAGMYAGLRCGGFLGASNTACKTFDATADGYTRAEAVAVVVLKRLSDARRDGDMVHGVIRGIVTNHSTDTNPITRPSAEAQKSLLRRVLSESLRQPEDVDYVELHGSGTQAGDLAEIEAVAAVLGGPRRRRPRGSPGKPSSELLIGSIKANIGHSEGAAGVSALVKTLLMIRHDRVPPHIGLRTELNHNFPPLKELEIVINSKSEPLKPLERPSKQRRCHSAIILNCFGAAGGNTSILVEGSKKHSKTTGKQPKREEIHTTEPQQRIVVVSGKSRSALQANKMRLLEFFKKVPSAAIDDLSYTTCERRSHFPYRSAYRARNTTEIIKLLHDDTIEASPQFQNAPQAPHIIFVFSGQGGKIAGSAQSLYDSNSAFRDALDDYNQLSESLGFPGVLQYLITPHAAQASPSTVLEQVALIVFELAVSKMWKSWGVAPATVLGHSLGEYAALHLCGILSAADAIWLVGKRAGLVQKSCQPDTHRMLAVLAEEERLTPFLAEYAVEVSCRNSRDQTVVGGPFDSILQLQSRLKVHGIKNALVKTPYAFHTGQMDGILENLLAVGEQASFASQTQINFVSTVKGSLIDASPSWPEHLAKHARQSVLFSDAVESAMSLSPGRNTIFLTISPTSMCRDMTASNITTGRESMAEVLEATGTGSQACLDAITSSITRLYNSGVDIDWSRYHGSMEQSGSLLELPAYGFDLKNFWIPLKQSRHLPSSSPSLSSSSLSTQLDTPMSECSLNLEDDIHTIEKPIITNLQEEPLRSLIIGHAIRDKAICPAGVLVDMAFAIVLERIGKRVGLESIGLRSLRLIAAITIDTDTVHDSIQTLETTLQKRTAAPEFDVTFSGVERQAHHASCILRVMEDTNGMRGEHTTRTLIRAVSRISQLQNNTAANHFNGQMIYKMWTSVMQYSSDYHVLRNLTLAPLGYEACAKLQTTSMAGHANREYTIDPVWLDGAMQAAGFTVNMNVAADPGAVYVLTECAAIDFWQRPRSNNMYACYVHGEADGSADVIMNVTVFDEENEICPVAAISGMRFHKLKQRPETKSKSGKGYKEATVRMNGGEPSNQVISPTTKLSNSTPFSPSQRAILDINKSVVDSGPASLSHTLISILAKETHAEPDEIGQDTTLADLGVDSLVAPTISDTIRVKLGVEIPLIALLEAQTISDVISLCADIDPVNVEPRLVKDAAEKSSITMANIARVSDTTAHSASAELSSRVALLQGSSHCKYNLFLLPDASGSSYVYAGLPPGLSQQTVTRIYGLESPFNGTSAIPDLSMDTYCSLFVAAILRIQPTGPYLLGGWSIGGRLAYECARQIIQLGHKVSGLLVIESYARLTPNLCLGPEAISVEHLEATGFFGWSGGHASSSMAEWQKNHMLHLILMNSAFKLAPLYEDKKEDTAILQLVWSSNGDFSLFPTKILQKAQELSNGSFGNAVNGDHEAWLKESRPERSIAWLTEEWRELAGPRLRQHVVEGGHFDIMIPKVNEDLAHVITEALRCFCEPLV